MERKRIFVDGMESVSLTDGMIRMEQIGRAHV